MNEQVFWIQPDDLRALFDKSAGYSDGPLGNPIGVQVSLRWQPAFDDVPIRITEVPHDQHQG